MSLVTLNSDLRNFNKKPKDNSVIGLQTRARVDDVSRLTKFLFTSGNGALFQAKQALLIGLENAGNKNQIASRLVNTLARVAVLNGVILGQAAASGTGLHLSSKYIIDGGNYITNVNERVKADTRVLNTFQESDRIAVDKKTGSLLKQDPSNLQLPTTGSVLVFIPQPNPLKFVEPNPAAVGVGVLEKNIKKDSKLVYEEDNIKKPTPIVVDKLDKVQKDREKFELKKGNAYNLYMGPGYTTSAGNSLATEITTDSVNFIDIETGDIPDLDIIPFKIVIREPGTDPIYLYFRAFLDNLSDSYDGGWNTTNYIGRAEPVYTYNSFNRKIDFGFKIAAFTRDELFPLYNKLNTLISSTAPSYSNSFMRGVLSQVTIGDWINNIPGFFENISLDWDLNYPWEIDRGVSGTDLETSEVFETKKEAPKVPHILNVRASFRPIHDFLPEFRSPFIYNSDYWEKQKVENQEKNKIEAERIQQLRQEQQETFNRFVEETTPSRL